MNTAARFLHALARYVATVQLYGEEHGALEDAFAEVTRDMDRLLEEDATPSFSFFPQGKVVWGDSPLRDMERWEWAIRFAESGMERLEMSRDVEREELRAFLNLVARRTARMRGLDEEEEGAPAFPHIRYGALGVQAEPGEEESRFVTGGEVSLEEEAGTVAWIHEKAAEEGRVPVVETVAAVQSLSVAMHGARKLLAPFLKLKEASQYTASHCINVSILSMALAEELGMSSSMVQAIGSAGLLHDVGKMEVPTEILDKPGRLTAEERTIIERHPVEGSRILQKSPGELDLAAVVAFEHHMRWSGGGYPARHYDRLPHDASRVVQVCDFYDALRARRSYRAPLPPEKARGILEEESGAYLDPEYLEAFLDLVDRWDPSEILVEERDGEPAAAGEGGDGEPAFVLGEEPLDPGPEFKDPGSG